MGRGQASRAERDYYRRIGEKSRRLEDATPPRSLEEMFNRLEEMRRRLGALTVPGLSGEDESELLAHLRLYERWKEIRRRGARDS
jgi:hypothetical protein